MGETRKTSYDVTPQEAVLMQRAANCDRAVKLGKAGLEVCKEALRSLRDGKSKYSNGQGITVAWNRNPKYDISPQVLINSIGEEKYAEHFTKTEIKHLLTKTHLRKMVDAGVVSDEAAEEATSVTYGDRKFTLTDGRTLSIEDLQEVFSFLQGFSAEELGLE